MIYGGNSWQIVMSIVTDGTFWVILLIMCELTSLAVFTIDEAAGELLLCEVLV